MERKWYPAVNIEKNIFRTAYFMAYSSIYYGRIVIQADSKALRAEFMENYIANFNITGGCIMETFLGMEVQQTNSSIKLHLDHYIQEILTKYEEYIKKTLRPNFTKTSSKQTQKKVHTWPARRR